MKKKRAAQALRNHSKRGDISLWVIFELITVVTILILLLSVAYSKARGDDVAFSYVTKDIALFIDLLHAIPGDVTVYYPIPAFGSQITLSITNTSVSGESIGIPETSYQFMPSAGIQIVGDEYKIAADERFALPIQKQAGTIRFSDVSETSTKQDVLPQVRYETREDDLSNNQFVFGFSRKDPRLSEFIRQGTLSQSTSASFDNFHFIRLSQDAQIINAKHPNLMVGVVTIEQSNLSEMTVYYSSREGISEASKKLATLFYNGVVQRVHTDRAHLSQKQDPVEETVAFRLDEIEAPTVVIALSQDLYQALGEAEMGELVGNAIYTYYTT
jgi:hypothetical protein